MTPTPAISGSTSARSASVSGPSPSPSPSARPANFRWHCRTHASHNAHNSATETGNGLAFSLAHDVEQRLTGGDAAAVSSGVARRPYVAADVTAPRANRDRLQR